MMDEALGAGAKLLARRCEDHAGDEAIDPLLLVEGEFGKIVRKEK